MKDEFRANFMRMGIILSFGLGSVVGGLAFHRFQYYGFLLPSLTSGLLFSAMLYFQVWKVRHKSTSPSAQPGFTIIQ